jgi:hypothetical protein
MITIIIIIRIEICGETLTLMTMIIFLRIEISGETLFFVLVLR